MKDGIHSKVSGVSYNNEDGSSRQEYIRKYCRNGKRLTLIPEPKNEYDTNAIGVWVQAGEKLVKIGFLENRLAGDINRETDESIEYYAIISQVTGGTSDKPTRGVNIQLHKTFANQPHNTNEKPEKDNLDVVRSKSKSFGNVLAIVAILFVLLLIFMACWSLVSCSPNSQTDTEQRCIQASTEQLDFINYAVQTMQDTNYIVDGWAVKSRDYENVYMVAAKIYGPGIENGSDPAVWAVGGDPNDPHTWLAVDGLAKEFTNLPDASKTDAAITLNADGVNEAKSCYEEIK